MNDPNTSPFLAVISGRARDLGGFSVTRILPAAGRRAVGPFVFLDEMGPTVFAPGGGINVRPHPHIGLSTVTFLFEGEVIHRDSLGVVKAIRPGEVNLMTAGRGVVHSERTDPARRETGGSLHGLQFWVALRKPDEECEPGFWHHASDTIPSMTLEGGGEARVVVGEAHGARSPVVHPSDPLLVVYTLPAGTRVEVAASDDERALTVVDGNVAVDGVTLAPRDLGMLHPGKSVTVTAETASRVALIGGPALDGPRLMEWNFVASTPALMESAKERWRRMEFALVPGDDVEFIPLPDVEKPGAH